jgi:hypothetical protein
MNPDDNTQDKELLERFRRASNGTSAAPSDAVRAAILAEGRRVAEQLKSANDLRPFDVSKPAANDARWRLTAYGTAGAAVLAALLIAPRFWESAPPVTRNAITAAPSATESAPAAPSSAPAPLPKLEEIVVAQATAPVAAASKPAAKSAQNLAPAQDSIVVTQARRSENYRTPAPAAAAASGAARADAAREAVVAGAPLDAASVGASPVVTLLAAAEAGDLAQTTILLDRGAAIDAPDELGRTPLMLAVVHERVDVARLLLNRGADPNVADKAGSTPLALAKQKNLPDLVKWLERAGAH